MVFKQQNIMILILVIPALFCCCEQKNKAPGTIKSSASERLTISNNTKGIKEIAEDTGLLKYSDTFDSTNNNSDIVHSNFPNCRKAGIMQFVMSHLDSLRTILNIFYLNNPSCCGREVIATLYINPDCDIFGFKISLWGPSHSCENDNDLRINPKTETEYKKVFSDWLNSIVVKETLHNYSDTLFIDFPFFLDKK